MVSWNVNGWHRKKYTIEEFMQKECITIMVVQETLNASPNGAMLVDLLYNEERMYADNVIALEESSDAVSQFCKKIHKWGQEWGMELGIKKCRVMCWTEDSWVRENHQRTCYLTPDGEIRKVDLYKYL
ncbi:hypothetical protein C8Q72DRAFT_799393 [Fomitopsis betulina]|nr:hypothetical protein C8Q72DRAFT_799393 [Fomitopsis betulina]